MTPDPAGALTIDGFGPLPIIAPATAAEIGELVRRCAAEGKAVYPVGGRTMLDYGTPPSRPGVAVDLRRLDQVIDYPARDMTITAQAGITVAKLQEILRAEGQQLPIDVPDPERATLGMASVSIRTFTAYTGVKLDLCSPILQVYACCLWRADDHRKLPSSLPTTVASRSWFPL